MTIHFANIDKKIEKLPKCCDKPEIHGREIYGEEFIKIWRCKNCGAGQTFKRILGEWVSQVKNDNN